MGGYSDKKSLFFIILATTHYFKIHYISLFFPSFKPKIAVKWTILAKIGNFEDILAT